MRMRQRQFIWSGDNCLTWESDGAEVDMIQKRIRAGVVASASWPAPVLWRFRGWGRQAKSARGLAQAKTSRCGERVILFAKSARSRSGNRAVRAIDGG